MPLLGPKTSLYLQTQTETNTAYGLTTTWATEVTLSGVLTKHAGRVLTYTEKETEDRPMVRNTLTFFCDYPVSYTVNEKKRLATSTRTFQILSVYNPANCNHHLEIELMEIL